MISFDQLPIRDDLRGKSPYGAPQFDVPVRLNVNENAFPLPNSVVCDLETALSGQLHGLNRYPDREFTTLRHRLASYLGTVLHKQGSGRITRVDPAWLWAANGSNEVLSHIVQAFGGPGRTVLGFSPSYSMHPLISTGTGARWVEERRAADFGLGPEHVVEAINKHKPDITFLCTPNNPTGGALGLDVVQAALNASTGMIIVDEAYAEFARPGFRTAIDLIGEHPRLIVSRTMSKAFAFAGVRLGYAIAQPAVIDALRLVRLPYHLSALTQAAAVVALDHSEELLANVDVLIANRDRMSRALTNLGFNVVPSDSNFVLFGGVNDPQALFEALCERGILVRNIGIDGHVRVNAGTDAETEAFLHAITTIVSEDPTHLAQKENR